MGHQEQHYRKSIRVTGVVQGVGFRPFVWKLAHRFNLNGWVRNDSAGVTMHVQGSKSNIARFIAEFHPNLPTFAKVDEFEVTDIPSELDTAFTIVHGDACDGESTPVLPEIAVCDDCLAEMNDSANRRYRYPFINCTRCGPRFTILLDLPYDRSMTTMNSFTMCGDCLREYENPADRRFHAQPNACHECGPRVWFVSDSDSDCDANFYTSRDTGLPVGDHALKAFANVIQQGDVVAVKGIGGFHFACDATNDRAIERLRQRKRRIDKPFAVMVRDHDACDAIAIASDQEQALLESPARPIVLLKTKPGSSLSSMVAPGNDFIGVMLPYSPLHALLLHHSSPLVMTSGNLTDEPIVRTNLEAKQRLSKIADHFLLHDRDIHVVCDDSVVRCIGSDPLPIRRSRGYAPLPIRLPDDGQSVLAVGGEIKAAFCVAKKRYAYMSPHIGDMGNLETLDAMQRSIQHFLRLFRIEPQVVVADLHPGYLSTNWAKEFADARNVPFLQVQHHHAHVASLIAEHGLPDNHSIIGCCFDGTGFGPDRAIWGGEFLVSDGCSFDRFAHLKYVPLPGGDVAIHRPYRTALAHLFAAGLPWDPRLPCVEACDGIQQRVVRQQLEKNLNCVSTSSMGRMFDAVASLIGIRQEVNYEAQAAIEFEAIAAQVLRDASLNSSHYSFAIEKAAPIQIDPTPVLSAVCDEWLNGERPAIIAGRFHHSVAAMIVDVCAAARDQHSLNQVGLTGGVFQNVQLLSLAKNQLEACGFEVLIHRQVPPNDAGLALGQSLVGRAIANSF